MRLKIKKIYINLKKSLKRFVRNTYNKLIDNSPVDILREVSSNIASLFNALSCLATPTKPANDSKTLSALSRLGVTNEITLYNFAYTIHLPIYWFSIFLVYWFIDAWHIFVWSAIIMEFVLKALRRYTVHGWMHRIFTVGINFVVLNAWVIGHPELVAVFIGTLNKFFMVNGHDLVTFHNNLLALDEVVYYHYNYFLVMYFSFYAAAAIIFIPFASACVALLFGFFVGHVLTRHITTSLMFITFFFSSYLMFIFPVKRENFFNYVSESHLFADYGSSEWKAKHIFERAFIGRPGEDHFFRYMYEQDSLSLELNFGHFIKSHIVTADYNFMFDSVSTIMVFTITLISALVHLYSNVYMKNDPHSNRFFGYLSLFTFFMIVLVTGGNLIILYIGWEGVGLVSYLLISFWYTRPSAVKAANKAILVNKIGDMFLILATGIIIYYSAGTTNIAGLDLMIMDHLLEHHQETYKGISTLDAVAMSLVIAAFVKSAQLFFHTWLPDAMEGPTPVSALLHAATMVTAGVYLIIRFSFIIEGSAMAKTAVFFIGFATVVYSSLVASTQYDIKKIIAYSTCSQLGLMFFSCGMSAYDLALFHFFNHAFFKCLLFLLAGTILHELHNEQDIRNMGDLARKMPVTFIFFSVAGFALAGVPGFSGAASKDLIILLANYMALHEGVESEIVRFTLLAANFIVYLTVIYTARLIFFVFIKPSTVIGSRGAVDKSSYKDPSVREAIYLGVFTFLAVMSVVGGNMFKHYFIFTDGRFINIKNDIAAHGANAEAFASAGQFRLVVFLATIICASVVMALHHFVNNDSKDAFKEMFKKGSRAHKIYLFFSRKGYFDEFYNTYIVMNLFRLSDICNKMIEHGMIHFIVMSIWKFFSSIDRKTLFNTSNFNMRKHLFYSFGGLFVLIIISFFFMG